MSSTETPLDERSLLERTLGLITDVRAGEGITALLLSLNIFVLLSAYYVIKPVREAFILVMEDGARYKSYTSAAIAIVLLFAVPAYGSFASRVKRNRLVVSVTLFFASHLVLFYLGSATELVRNNIGIVFYVWVGIFNMMVVAQFWALANDLYTEDQGKRLFPLVGIGASVGAAAGAWVAKYLVYAIGNYPMLLVAAVMLAFVAFLTQVVHARESKRAVSDHRTSEGVEDAPARDGRRKNPFGLVFGYRYLTLLAVFSLVFTWVNTNGEYMLSALVSERAQELSSSNDLGGLSKGEWISSFYSDFFFYVNILGFVLQAFVVSRLVRYVGLGPTFFLLPAIAMFDAVAVAVAPVLAILRVGKIAENATDYSVNNTVRNMLWLPTTREMKYNAKQAVDTFFVRMGDVASAGLVFVGAGLLSWSVQIFAISNILLIGIWVVVALAILREMPRMRRSMEQRVHDDEQAMGERAPAP
ncbi:MAG: translocase [Myxococcales bacterium]|nr:translocase [Myxococcales bacterium]